MTEIFLCTHLARMFRGRMFLLTLQNKWRGGKKPCVLIFKSAQMTLPSHGPQQKPLPEKEGEVQSLYLCYSSSKRRHRLLCPSPSSKPQHQIIYEPIPLFDPLNVSVGSRKREGSKVGEEKKCCRKRRPWLLTSSQWNVRGRSIHHSLKLAGST